jgi:hypothetical protein
MKKNYYLIFGVIAMALTACQTIEEDSFDFGLTAVMESTVQTKTSMSPAEAGGYNVLWSDTDKIAVYPDDATSPSTFSLTGGAGTTKATFVGEVYGDSYTAFYPQNMLVSREGKILNINLPEEQTYNPGTFATDAYPMAAYSKSKELHFKNLCSVMHIALSGTAMVDKIIFRANGSLKASGAATVDMSNPDAPVVTMDPYANDYVTLNIPGGVQLSASEDTDFYVVLPPQDYSEGFTVEIYSGDKYYEKSHKKDFTMVRSKMHTAKLSGYTGPINANRWLTFTSQGVTSIGLENESGNAPVLFYSTDTQHWTEWDYSPLIFTVDSPLYICGDNPDGFSSGADKFSYFKTYDMLQTPSDNFSVSGDIMSLISKDEEVTTIPCDYCFCRLFKGTPSLKDAPTLSATTLTKHCYDRMFSQATDLTSPPEGLPAITLKDSCYFAMFEGCSQITYAPELLATTLADGCYHSMFSGCYALQEAPELPATTLAKACYQSMFNGCGSLTDAPELPATELAEACYFKMFSGCGELVNATELSAMTLAPKCYWQMFYNCKKLQAAPDLPATTLAQDCYTSMFSRCENLSVAPEVLPATTLVKNCYNEMFYGCKNLEVAPELPATTLTPGCYYSMFNGCSKLHNIKCLATNIDADNCVTNWVQGVASSGCFVKAPAMASWTTGVSGIPADWIVMNDGDTPSGGSEGTSDEDWN